MYLIAEAKKKENIAEYILYMWQMEDLLRGMKFDMDRIQYEVLAGVSDEEERKTNLKWFEKLASEMKSDSAEVSGHHRETYEVFNELALLQQTLLTVLNDKSFQAVYADVKPVLEEFRSKSDKTPKSDVEMAFTALYGVLTLRLSGKKVTEETQKATEKIRSYVRYLAKAYHQMKSGTLPMNN